MAASGRYIGSPGIAILPDGSYLAKCDEFGPYLRAPGARTITRVFRSRDRGRSWRQLCEIRGLYWASLFEHRGALYLMGTDGPYGRLVIRRSTDGGASWSEPRDGRSGVILDDARYHCAPVPVVEHRGRLWRAMEDAEGPGSWGAHFRAFMMSAPVDADLLDARSWTCSNRIERDPRWLDGRFRGWLEGNALVSPDGEIVNLLRVDTRATPNVAALLRVGAHGREARFDPERGFVRFPGGCKKFTARRDPVSGTYWSLANWVPPRYAAGRVPGRTRNTVALIASPDLRTWSIRWIVLHHPDVEHHGFQYLDWCFEGADLVVVSRTAHDDCLGGAHDHHDANFLTFHRVRDFRDLDPAQLPAELAELLAEAP
jgi:hypothetical protein